MKNYIPSESYLDTLKRRREDIQMQREATPKTPPLHTRMTTWYNGLSHEEKNRAYSMQEFRILFGDTPQKIGATLWSLGWTRKRMWRDDQPTARYWQKKV
jgi:hypothetical protein